MTSPRPASGTASDTASGTGLTDRYVHAVVRSLPEEQRADVADELRATIADRVDALLAADPDLTAEAAEYAAVAELDDPIRLSAGYSGRPLHLIGPAAYPSWLRLIRVLLLTVLPIVAAVVAVVGVFEERSFGGIVGDAAWTTFNAGVQIVFWVTLIWVLVERGSAPGKVAENLGATWSPDDLPEPPRATRFPIGDTVAAIAFIAIAIGFLVGQHFWGWRGGEDNGPLVDPDLWSSWLPVLIGVLLAMIGLEIAKYRTGHWTVPLAVANTALELAFAGLLAWLALTERLLDPGLVDVLARHDIDAGHASVVVALGAIAVGLWDILDGWRKVPLGPA